MAINVGSAIAYLELDTSKFRESIKGAGEDLKKFSNGDGVENLVSGLMITGSTITHSVIEPLIVLRETALNTAMDFELQMSRIKSSSWVMNEEFRLLREQALKLGIDTNFSAIEAANGIEIFASAGFDWSEIMSSMLGVLRLTSEGGIDIATASGIATSSLKSFGLEAEKATYILDVIAKISVGANVGIATIGEGMKVIAPVAKRLGVSFEETAVAIGIFSSVGIKGSEAGKMLTMVFDSLEKVTGDASKKMRELGINFLEAQEKVLSFGDAIKQLQSATKGLTEAQKESAMEIIVGKDAMEGILAILAQGSEKFNELSKSLRSCDGATKEMANGIKDNLEVSLDSMSNSTENSSLKIGGTLTPAIKKVVDFIAELGIKFNELSAPIQELIIKISSIAEAINPVVAKIKEIISTIKGVIATVKDVISTTKEIISTIKDVISFIKDLKKTISEVLESFKSLKTVGSVFGDIAAMISPQVLIIIAIIAAIGFIVYEVIKHWNELKAFFTGFWNGLKSVFSAFWSWLVNFFSQWGPTILAIIAPFLGIPLLIAQHWNEIQQVFTNLFNHIATIGNNISQFFQNAITGWISIWNQFINFIGTIGTSIINGFLNGLNDGWSYVANRMSGFVTMISTIVKNLLGINSPSKVFAGYGESIGEGLIKGLDDKDSAVTSKVGGLANKIKDLGNVKPNFDGLNSMALSGAYGGNGGLGLSNSKQLNFTPNITMNVSIADTGTKGTAQLTSELKSMTQNAIKNSMVDQFMSDALRL